jgi:protein-S-isoprenylcysteine O-methyltransferase Ste14
MLIRPLVGVGQALAFSLVLGVWLFGCAGRLDVPQFWIYIAIFAAACIAGPWLIDPGLYAERVRPGGRPIDPRYWLIFVAFGAHWGIAGLGVRLHWGPALPPAVWIAGNILVAAAIAFDIWAMHVNRFFSSVVSIQNDRGQVVVSDGPYAFVRHPGYLGALVLALSSGFALGSLWSVLPALVTLPLLYVRTVGEDRTLQAELPGYADYAKRVRWKVIPGVW